MKVRMESEVPITGALSSEDTVDYLDNEELFKQLQNEPSKRKEIEEKLVINNLNLVKSIVYRYRHAPCEYEDLIAVGNLQLYRCIVGYSLKSGAKFSTYAVDCIRKQLLSYIQSNMTALHMSERDARRLNANDMQKKRESVDYENRDKLRENTCIPQVTSINDDNFTEVPVEEWRLSNFENQDFLDWLNIKLQNILSYDEYKVIDACFGINTGEVKTLKDISVRIGCSESQVRKLRDKAYIKIRKQDDLKEELMSYIAELKNRG